jgi:hypothetical protein
MTEAEWQDNVVELAHFYGWVVAHFRNSRVGDRHMTATAYDGAGFPDLVLAHPDKGVIFAELKSPKGRVSSKQTAWLDTLERSGSRAVVWRPSDLANVHRLLRRGVK